ncbi:hypothetical protein vseg_001742 [Gypsophila vaccaria]
MSTTTLSQDYKKPPLRRDDSDELDVFEATRYFSDYNDNFTLEDTIIKEQKQGYLRQGRASLDIPSLKHNQHYYKQYHQNVTTPPRLNHHRNHHHHNHHHDHHQEQKQVNENKKYKQPSSPGGKLAHFLNTLFNQAIKTSKKKKQLRKTTTQLIKPNDEDEDHDHNPSSGGGGGRRLRRNSISHFQTSITKANSVIDSKSMYSSSSSGFRTPPPYTTLINNTPPNTTKSSLQSSNNVAKTTMTTTTTTTTTSSDYKQVLATLAKYKIREHGHQEHVTEEDNADNKKIVDKTRVKKIINHEDEELVVDEGEESDASSSDLFELKIDYEFGLPVYETTHMDKIKRPS